MEDSFIDKIKRIILDNLDDEKFIAVEYLYKYLYTIVLKY